MTIEAVQLRTMIIGLAGSLVLMLSVTGCKSAGPSDVSESASPTAEVTSNVFEPAEFCADPQPAEAAPAYSTDTANQTRLVISGEEVFPSDYPDDWANEVPALVGCVRSGAREHVQDCGDYAERIAPGTNGYPVEVILYRRSFELTLYKVRTAEPIEEAIFEVDPECPESVEVSDELETEHQITEDPESQDVYVHIEDYVFPAS
ncbi:hypothetical protein [Glycomyces sp. YM15]|uniref:hypothetical protein n=1 Tax=Glycomyces sp. YM15 TaxID=2800446 RepID=UPI001965339E|nr:hypothetical protein [Glycomyces sp. YM15]